MMINKRLKYLLASSLFLIVSFLCFLSFNNIELSKANSMFFVEISPNDSIQVTNSYGELSKRQTTFGFSNVDNAENAIVSLKNGGIVFNKTPINSILSISVAFDENSFSGASLYYGNFALPYENCFSLPVSGTVTIPEGNSFFTIRSEGMNCISYLKVNYSCETVYVDQTIPAISITTELDEFGGHKEIESKEEYISCVFDLTDQNNHLNDLTADAQIRLRGNSTISCPKKPYRVKFEKKQSLFGLTKAKNWCLLADYMDGSYMHNFSALNFAHMIRGEEFTPTPKHVNVFLNGQNIGLYLLTENPDEKKGRTDIEMEDSRILSLFDEDNNFDFKAMPFYVERDDHIASDPSQIENETYFVVEQQNCVTYDYLIRYPKKENFYSSEGDKATFHLAKFSSFVKKIKAFMTDLHNCFLRLSRKKAGAYESIESMVNVDSIASYSLTDLVFKEMDHCSGSFKVYKKIDDDKVSFGPTWDYDSLSFGLEFNGRPSEDPYRWFKSYCVGWDCGEFFMMAFYYSEQGRNKMSTLWDSFYEEMTNSYLDDLKKESVKISQHILNDVAIWQENRFNVAFDNIRYCHEWLTSRIEFLNQDFNKQNV